jgi:hypothetical protein
MMQDLDEDFLGLFRRHIVFLANAKGVIRSVGPLSARHGHLAGLLAPGRDLKELFDFNTLESLDDLPSGRGFIPGRPDANFFETLEEFHTILSMASLEVRKQGDNSFLCVLSLNDMLPNFYPGRNISIILTDYADCLLGFNQSFYSLFMDRFPQPDAMLRQPLHRLLSPGPAEIQAR